MEDERKRNGVKSLLEAIKSSDGLDARISLLGQLEDSHPWEASDLVLLIESLPVSSELKVLSVASKCLEINESACLSHFLGLGTKASMWCRNHVQVSLAHVHQTREEEHFLALSLLLLDCLMFSCAMIAALTGSIYFGERERMLMVETFIAEQFGLTRTSIFAIQRFRHNSDLIKVAQILLDAIIKLCRRYVTDVITESMKDIDDGIRDHIITVTALSTENLHELGATVSTGGGSLVTVLNTSWKGVVSLLQLGKKILPGKVKIEEILQSLISLSNTFMSRAAATWISSQKTEITLPEAKRTFLPIKFFLINAVRISSDHPHEAMMIHREIVKCVCLVSYYGVIFSKESELRAASEALADVLDPTASLLLHGIVSSDDISDGSKALLLDAIFMEKIKTDPSLGSATLGRIMVFMNVLKSCVAFRAEIISLISKNLGNLLSCLADDDVYPFMFILHVPVSCGSSKGITWMPLLHSLLHSLKTFMIAAASSSVTVSQEMEDFLHQNLFHPHCLCHEIVLQLWCFFMRHVEPEASNQIFDRWFSLLKTLAPSASALDSLSPLRRFARSVGRILSHAPEPTVDHAYSVVFDGAGSSLPASIVRAAMMMEGFPLSSLSSNLKKISAESILADFRRFIANYGKRHDQGSTSLGLPLHAFACALRSSLITDGDVTDDSCISQHLRFSLYLIREQHSARDGILLSAALDIIPRLSQSCSADEIKDVVKELQTLSLSFQLKPALVSFMAGLCRMEMRENEEDPTCSAAWGLFHALLRERNWAFLHLSLEGFGYFAARTPCTQLWRFVPHDAALSYDVETGSDRNEERFMAQLKAFLERETDSGDQLDHLRREAAALQRRMREKEGKRKRKLPEEISTGISMLQSGLKLLQQGLSRYDGVDFREELFGQLSSLKCVIRGLSRFSDH